MQRPNGRHAATDNSMRRHARHPLFTVAIFAICSALLSVVLIASPASAMTTSAAIKACDANPNCEMTWGAQNDSITMRVKGSKKVIDCPKKEGECVAVIQPKGQSFDAGRDRPNAALASDGQGGEKFRASFDAVLKACQDARAVFADDVARYSCTKSNCDGKGGSCTVSCSKDGSCEASTPKIMVGNVTILMLLQNGSNVNHATVTFEPNHPDNSSAGAPSAGGSSAPAAGGGVPGGPPSFL